MRDLRIGKEDGNIGRKRWFYAKLLILPTKTRFPMFKAKKRVFFEIYGQETRLRAIEPKTQLTLPKTRFQLLKTHFRPLHF